MIRRLILFLILGVLFCGCVSAEVINVSVSEDAYTNKSTPTTNYGDQSTINVWNADAQRYGFLKAYVPEYTTSAFIHLYVESGTKGSGNYININRVSSDWSENTITHNNPPSLNPNIFTYELDRANSTHNGQWVTLNVSSAISYPGNYSFKIYNKYGSYDNIASSEHENTSIRPYIEIHTGVCPVDVNLNNKTNDDKKAFLVNSSEVIRFTLNADDIASCLWQVNKTNQSETGNIFDFVVPSFDVTQPSTGIWEIGCNATYTNGSHIIREWLVSGLNEEQAPDFIDYFTDQNSVWRSDYITDPWGRQTPIYLSTTNFISKGYAQNTTSTNYLVSKNIDLKHGTFKIKASHDLPTGTIQEFQYKFVNSTIGTFGIQIAANDNHDYFSNTYGTINYIPISKRWICPAPSGRSWSIQDAGWREYTVIRTQDDWWYLYENGSLIPEASGHYDIMGSFDDVQIMAGSYMKVDCAEVYENQYLYPPNRISYGAHSQYWDFISSATKTVTNDNGIILYVHNTTLKQISETLNNTSLMAYDDATQTATVKTNIFIEAGSDFNVTNETLLFDTSAESLYIRPESGCIIRIDNSTVSTTSDNPLIWNFVSPLSQSIFDPVRSPNVTTVPLPTNKPHYNWRGRCIVEDSKINNSCNLYIQSPHELVINDTIFSNMSEMSYGDNHWVASANETSRQRQLYLASGEKSLRLVPSMDMAQFSMKNVSFIDPKEPISLEIIGGQWVLNATTVRDSDLSGISASVIKAQKQELLPDYKLDDEKTNLSMLNCKYNESRFIVRSDNASIKTKYYADIVVRDASGPVQNAIITPVASNESGVAENLYQYEQYVPDSSEAGAGGAYPPYSGSQAINYQGGWYPRWWNAQPLGYAITNANGRTSLPSGDSNNTIVLTDKVWTNETGTQINESITYSMTVAPTGYNNITLDNIDPDEKWYRPNTDISKYTITVIANDSTDPRITAYAPSDLMNNYAAGDTVKFQMWANEEPVSVMWSVGETDYPTDEMTFETVVGTDPITVGFEAETTAGPLTKTWTIDPTHIPVTPGAAFTANRTTGTYPLWISFTDQSDGEPYSWAWDFDNDGVIDSSEQNPQYKYKVPGTYTVKLTVLNNAGADTETKTRHITVSGDSPIRKITHSIYGYFYNMFYQIFYLGAMLTWH